MILGCRSCSKHHSLCDCPASVSRAEPIVALRDAEATIRATSDASRMRLLRKVLDNEWWAARVEGSVRRATSIGAQQYGDATYHKTDAVVEGEGNDEIEDWIFYEGVIVERLP